MKIIQARYSIYFSFVMLALVATSCKTQQRIVAAGSTSSSIDKNERVGEADGEPASYDDACPYELVQEKPHFSGVAFGTYAAKFVTQCVKYAPNKNEPLQTKVICSFIVTHIGRLANVEVVGKKPEQYSSLDNEVVHCIKNLPACTPAMQHDDPVDVLFTLPISFHVSF